MTLVLALDTALAGCSVAVVEDGQSLAAETRPMARGQAEALMPLIDSVLTRAARTHRQMDLVAVTVGPGSFTGLRVGLSAGRGLALAIGCPVRGVTTLEVLADAALDQLAGVGDAERTDSGVDGAAGPVLVVLDGRRGDVIVQLFRGRDDTGLPVAAGEPLPMAVVDAVAGFVALGAPGRPLPVTGDGIDLLRHAAGVPDVFRPLTVDPLPDPVRVARLAVKRGAAQALPPVPLYLRPPEAVPAANGGRLRPLARKDV